MTDTPKKKTPKKKTSTKRKVPNPYGRTRVPPEMVELALSLIAEGRSIGAAATEAGINYTTLYAMRTKAKKALEAGAIDTPDIRFVDALEAAQAKAINRARGVIWECATEDRDWKAAECLLKRIDPEWTDVAKIEVSNPDGTLAKTDPRVTVNLVLSEAIDTTKSPFKEA